MAVACYSCRGMAVVSIGSICNMVFYLRLTRMSSISRSILLKGPKHFLLEDYLMLLVYVSCSSFLNIVSCAVLTLKGVVYQSHHMGEYTIKAPGNQYTPADRVGGLYS
jgi:hypothetical protein